SARSASAPSTPTHSGIVAHTIAAPPDATVCVPIATKPLPPANNSTLIGAMRSHSRGGGSGTPRRSASDSITRPANANRMEPWRNGGISVTTIDIARYVDPQITYTAVRARIRRGSTRVGATVGEEARAMVGQDDADRG